MTRRTGGSKIRVDVAMGVAFVELTRGQEAVIDIADVSLVSGHCWCANPNEAGGFYAVASGRGKPLYMHRLLMDTPSDLKTDHRDNNGLNNRRDNLRVTSNQRNMENRSGANTNSKTGVRGVSAHKCRPSGMMWCARVNSKGQKPLARYFPYTLEGFNDACAAVVELRECLHTHADGR